MNRRRDKLHLRLTAVAFVAAIGLPLLLHKPADPDVERAPSCVPWRAASPRFSRSAISDLTRASPS